MNAPSIDVKDMLVAESLGLTFADNLFIGREPTDPNNCTTIFDTPGRSPQLNFNKNEQYFYPSIQIRVRNTSYVTGWNLINDIKEALHGRAHETWNTSLYTVISCMTEPALLDWDDNNRCRFVVNFDLQREPV